MSIWNTLTSYIPTVLFRGFFAVKDFVTGNSTAQEATQDLSCGVAKDVVIDLGKRAVKGVVANALPTGQLINIVTNAVVDMAVEGTTAVVVAETQVGKTLIKAGICAVNTTLAAPLGPVGMMVANGVTSYAVDKAADVYQAGIHTAYNNYKLHDEWNDLKYRQYWGTHLEHNAISEEELGMSFLKMSACAA